MNFQWTWILVLGVASCHFLFAEAKRSPNADATQTQTAAPSAGAATVPAGTRRDEGDFVTEKRSDGTTVKYKKKASYDFEGANIDGMYNKPSGSYISNIKDVKARSIIRIRENFDPEVIDSSRLVK